MTELLVLTDVLTILFAGSCITEHNTSLNLNIHHLTPHVLTRSGFVGRLQQVPRL